MLGKKIFLLCVLITAALLLASCATPTPQTVVVIETVQVLQTVQVPVEKTVVEQQIITATPVPKKLVEFGGFYPADSPWGK